MITDIGVKARGGRMRDDTLERFFSGNVPAETLKLIREMREHSAIDRAFAVATAVERGALFCKQYNLKRTQAHVCIGRLIGENCRAMMEPKRSRHSCTPPADDHGCLYLSEGKPCVYLSQPYGLTSTQTAEIVEYCHERGLEFWIDTSPSWWFPARVLSIIYFPKSRPPELVRKEASNDR